MIRYAPVARTPTRRINGIVLGANVERFRVARGWSRPELGRRAKLDDQYIYRLERGDHPRSSIDTAQKLADALELSFDELTRDPNVLEMDRGNDEIAKLIRDYAPTSPPEDARKILRYLGMMSPEDKAYWLGVFERVYGGIAHELAE